jgi:hypothetical protein
LIGIELGMGNETTRIVQNRAEKALSFTTTFPLDVWTIHQIGLPDLIGELGLKLFVSGLGQQLALGQTLFFQKSIQRAFR